MNEDELQNISEKEQEVLKLIKKEIYSYSKKYINIKEGCAYFIIDGAIYGYCILKGDAFQDIPFIWLEDADYQIKPSEGPDILFKGHTKDYVLLNYEDLLELYTLLNMENKLQKNRDNIF